MSYVRPPDLWPINEEAWAIWEEVKTQWRGGGMGPIGLDYAEVRQAAQDLGIDLSPCMKRKIRTMERVILESANSKES